jgi:cytochrome P450
MVEPDIRLRSGSRLPQGPPFLPRLLTGKIFRQTAADFMLQNAQRYGDIVYYTAGRRQVFQFNHPDLIQELLVNNEPRHHRGVVMRKARFVLGNGLLTSEEPLHMRQRRLAQPAFHRQRIAAYGDVISSYSTSMIARWQSGHVVDLHSEMLLLALRIVGKCLFDTDVESEVRKIAAAVDAFMGFLPLVFLPFSHVIERLPIGPMKRIRAGEADLNHLIYGIIRERRQSPGDRGDLLSMLLAAVDTEENTGQMSDQQVRDECLTVLLAGHETTANGLSFALWLLAQHPDIQQKLHLEAESVLADRAPSADDYPRLRYTQMVFAETLRLFPPVWVTARTCAQPYRFHGCDLPAGAILLAPQVAVHRDPRFYDHPLRFNPDRFAESARSARPRFAYFPFGGGSRQCIGESLAWMEGVLVLATIARAWRVLPVRGSSTVLPVKAMITLRPANGLPLIVERRERSHRLQTAI